MRPSHDAPSLRRLAIETEQLSKLNALVAALRTGNRFYSGKLRTARLESRVPSLKEFTERMPFTRKDEIVADQQNYPPYGTNLTFSLECYRRFNQTSGTTGRPMYWLDTVESWDWMLDNWLRVYSAANVTPRDHIFFAFSFGPFLGFWTAFECAARLGCLCLPGGGMSSVSRLRTMIDNGATVLCCTPTYAIRLAEVAEEEKISLSDAKIKTLILSGEPGASIPGTRARIESLWHGARVVDHHGMTETGPVSYGCPKKPGVLHVIESSYIAEVVDPEKGKAVEPGESGELVLTNLGRIGSPLLRYRTGDVVRTAANSPCECGSYEMALEGGILGRTDDMLVVRGVNVYPSAIEELVRASGDVAEYRVEIQTDRALPEIKIQVEPAPGCANEAGLAERLETAMRTAFNLRVAVSVVPSGNLPRFEMKAKRWVRV
jgi:phenylacetate-CoA ligase